MLCGSTSKTTYIAYDICRCLCMYEMFVSSLRAATFSLRFAKKTSSLPRARVGPIREFVITQRLSTSCSPGAAVNMATTWTAPPPCKTGDPLSAVFTPALLIDMDKMESNIASLSKMMKNFPAVAVRPHAKAHKCPEIAAVQVKHGAVGLCCQTLVEAEAMVYGGNIADVFITNQMIGKAKLRRMAESAKQAKISVCVDDVGNLKDISDVASEMGVNIDCVVEVNVGQQRCGVEPGEPAAELAQAILGLPGVMFKGIHCYQGWNQHIRKTSDREAAVGKVVELVKLTLEALKARKIECTYVTGAGTGSFPYESKSGVYTEIQPGSYIVMDADYARNLDDDGSISKDFVHSLYVLTTVQSVSADGSRAVVDAGMKAVSMDSGVPLVSDNSDLVYNIGGDEHGILKPAGNLKVGDLLWLIPGHCDPTVNLHDWILGVRNGAVEVMWPVLGRGPGV